MNVDAPRDPAPTPTSAPTPQHSLWRRWPRLQIRPADVLDVLVYLIVLGLFIQFFPSVIAESFLLALLTALLLKVVLEVVLRLKKKIVARMRRARIGAHRVANLALLVLLVPGSKFVVLELVALLFGEAVQLGGFFAVTALIAVLSFARAGVRAVITLSPREDSP